MTSCKLASFSRRTLLHGVSKLVSEIWSFTLREERRLRVFENMVFRRIFGPKSDEVTGEWRKRRNNEMGGGHLVGMGRDEAYTGFWWGKLRSQLAHFNTFY